MSEQLNLEKLKFMYDWIYKLNFDWDKDQSGLLPF